MIKSITTIYKGIEFRSRTEAKWAIYFDKLNIEWEYEQEGYILEDGTKYLPDFFLKGFGWVEVKGITPTQREIEKCRLLSKNNKGYDVALVDGCPKIGRVYPIFIEGECSEGYWSYYSRSKWGSKPFYGPYNKDNVCICDEHIIFMANNLLKVVPKVF